MENPVDHTVDLGLVNYVQHPTNPNYIVYRFAEKGRAESFEAALKEQDIWYEKDKEDKRGKEYTLFGIHKTDFKRTEKLNYTVEAKHKKPFIPFLGLRMIVLFIGLGLLTLAIVGYCKQQNKLASYDENGVLINSQE
jgi:hypothetical protein